MNNRGGPYYKMNILIGKFIGASKRKIRLFMEVQRKYGKDTDSYALCKNAITGYRCKIETLENLKAAMIELCNEETAHLFKAR